ncbi:MAG: hypothetical protein AAF986_07965 [Pseudomonadota bacterium]
MSFAKAERQGDVVNLLVDERAVWAFASPDLSSAIRDAWTQTTNWRVKLLLLSMIQNGPVPMCADLAEQAGMSDVNNSDINVAGINALKALKERKSLSNIVERLKDSGFGDANDKLASIAPALYPDYLSTKDLLEVIKTAKPPKKYSYNGFAPQLTSLFTSCPEHEQEHFLQSVADLALSEPHRAQHKRLSQSYGYLAKNFVHLACAIVSGTEDVPHSNGLIRILMAVERCKDAHDLDEKRRYLSEIANADLALKQKLFWADVEEIQYTKSKNDFEKRPWSLLHISSGDSLWILDRKDIPWLLEGAGDTSRSELDRLAAYFACLELAVSADVLSENFEELREVAEGKPRWLELLNSKKQQPQQAKWQKRAARRKAKAEQSKKRRDAIAAASWRKFRIELKDSLPTPDFSDGLKGKNWSLMYDLTRWLSWSVKEQKRVAPRSWRKLIPVFGGKVAFSYRDHFKQIWRSTEPRRPQWTGMRGTDHCQLRFMGCACRQAKGQ